jgi:hypothetical protein
MSREGTLSRRLLLAGLWLAGTRSLWAQARNGDDRGIGGTGVISDGDDRGIGGTGIVGVIQRFGSIFVNGERIGYAADVPVRIDGEPASAKALRIGQMARVVALRSSDGTLTTRRIDVVSEVVGPIDSLKGGDMTVLGQTVRVTKPQSWQRPGTRVAVFGLRRTDGIIVASLIAPHDGATTRVAGVLERGRDRRMRVGGLSVEGVDATLVGRRIVAEGRTANGVMQVGRARPDDFSDLAGAGRLLIEAYVRRRDGDLLLGSGHVARDLSRFEPSGGEARVVVNATLDLSGGLRADSVRSISHFPGASIIDPHPPGGGASGQPAGHTGGPSGPSQTTSPAGSPAGRDMRSPSSGSPGGGIGGGMGGVGPGGGGMGGGGMGGPRR